jgi:hypothetical protein
MATTLISLPLIFEATKKFHVFDAWAAALALSAVTAIVLLLAWRRQLAGVAWIFSILALLITPLLMMETTSVVPFALFLTFLGIATLWLGYILEWRTLRWIVAGELNAVLFVLAFLVATDRLSAVSPAMAIAVAGFAFAAYLTSFAVRTLVRQRDVVVFEIAQTLALLFTALGGAMWVAASRATLELALAIVVLLLGGASYAVAFAFIPRRFATPVNFVSYSSLALMLIVAGGAFVTHGIANSILWTALALACGALAVHYRKSSLALHASVYLFSGFVGAGVISLGFRSLLLPIEPTWIVPAGGAVLLLFASVMAATIRPIERQGDFTLWTAAKVIILAEVGWIVAALVTTAIGLTFLREPPLDHAVVAVVRTAVIAALTILTAWASRFERFSPGRLLCNPLLALLVMKLLWDDFRAGRPATLFASLAIVGVALIVTPHLKRHAAILECGGNATALESGGAAAALQK